MGWWRVSTTNDAKEGERRERVSWFSRFFACFVIQSTDQQSHALAYELYGLTRRRKTRLWRANDR